MLITACARGYTAVVRALVDANADLHCRSKGNQQAPLFVSASSGWLEIVELLIAKGADLNACDWTRSTPLIAAAVNGHTRVVSALIAAKARLDEINQAGQTALGLLASGGHDEAVDAMLAAGADLNCGETPPLSHAAVGGHVRIVRKLLAAGAAVNATNRNNETALFLVSTADSPAAMTVLIAAGADVECPVDCGHDEPVTPLVRSVWNRDEEAVAILLAAGADATVDSFLQWQRESLIWAAMGMDEDNRIASLLHAAGATWTNDELGRVPPERMAAVIDGVAEARKQIERAGFAAIRERTLEICSALHELELPAPQLIEIVTASCEIFAQRLPYHYLWDAVVLVKHFRERR